jgi:hypothetical protein
VLAAVWTALAALLAWKGEPSTAFYGGSAVVAAATLAAGAGCRAMAGWLAARRRHGACMAVAGALMLLIPVGTLVGGMTLTLLVRDEVKASFSA